jgi:hypothetical protein
MSASSSVLVQVNTSGISESQCSIEASCGGSPCGWGVTDGFSAARGASLGGASPSSGGTADPPQPTVVIAIARNTDQMNE